MVREELVGEALDTLYKKHGFSREDFFLQTKCALRNSRTSNERNYFRFTGIDGQDTLKPLPYDPTSPVETQVRASFEKSLSNLKTSWLDSYILHSPLRTPQLTIQAWKVLMELQDEGKIHNIGVSNCYDVRLLQYIIDSGGRMIDVVQNQWYEGNAWDSEVLQFCRSNGIYYEYVRRRKNWPRKSDSEFFRSFWTLSGSPSLLQSAPVQDIVRRTGCTAAQAVFRAAQKLGVTPLSGSKDEEHMKEGLAASSIDITEAEFERVKTTMESIGQK